MLRKIKYRLFFIKEIIPYCGGIKRFFLLNFILSIAGMILCFINPFFYKIFINDVLLGGKFSKITIVIVGYLSIFTINTLIGYIKNFANNHMTNHVTFRVKFKLWRGLFKQNFSTYEHMSIGDMKMRLDDDIGQISVFSGRQSIDYVISYFTMIGSLAFLFIIQWQLAIFSIIAIPLTFWFDNIISKREAKLNNSNRENDQKFSSWLYTSVQGWREIKALNLQKHERHQYIRYLHISAVNFAKWINYWTTRVLVIPKIKDQFLMQFSLYFIGGLLIINGNLTIGSLLVFVQYYGMLSGAIVNVSSSDAELQGAMPFYDRIMTELRKSSPKIKQKIKPIAGENSILFKNVCFTYPCSEKEVINNMSFIINDGERVAITGSSGCGKTTVLKLMTGMIEATSGIITFADIDLKEIDLSVMHRHIGFVMQDNMLFNTSIRENLLYGKLDATDCELKNVCKKAYIYDFINSLPDKYDTIIGEKGIKLSGGQRQRIVLARLFLRDVDVFIFDEATSALDQYSESIIHDAIKDIGKDKTIIVVSHRQSSVDLCDRKIVMGDVSYCNT
ncbi:MAG TPA: ABC transporter ATP-binding protein [Candidatus Paceibacterota bacterium]